MADVLDALFADTEDGPQVEPKEPAPTPEPAKTEAPKPAQVEEPPKPEAQPAPVKAPIEPGHVPISAMLDEREKRQKLERENAELRSKQQPQQIPSIHDDPEAYAEFVRGESQRIAMNERFSISEVMAAEKHGAEPVKAAMEWGMQRSQESPAFGAEYLKQRHPIDWVVRQHKRDGVMKEMGDDPDAWVRKRFAELNPSPPANGAAPLAQAAALPQPVAHQALPRPSLVSAPSAGGLQTQVVPKDKVLDRLGLDG